jgi:hypothetical protein
MKLKRIVLTFTGNQHVYENGFYVGKEPVSKTRKVWAVGETGFATYYSRWNKIWYLIDIKKACILDQPLFYRRCDVVSHFFKKNYYNVR